MKRFLLLIALCIGVAFSAYAQLAGTERMSDNLWLAGDRRLSFGPNPNASIQYSGGNLVIDVTSGGGRVSFPDGVDLGAGNLSFGSSLVFEGTTADAFETTLTVVDPTADRTITLPNQAGAAILSVGGVADAANAVSGANNGFVFEGATADANELTLVSADAGADATVTIPASTGTLCVGGATVVTTGANAACNTTCGAGRCIGGQDTDSAGNIVGCADAAADRCFCIP